MNWDTRWRSWLKHSARSRKVAGSIPNGVIGIFHLNNSSGRTMALGRGMYVVCVCVWCVVCVCVCVCVWCVCVCVCGVWLCVWYVVCVCVCVVCVCVCVCVVWLCVCLYFEVLVIKVLAVLDWNIPESISKLHC
jgi:hypothetical protein